MTTMSKRKTYTREVTPTWWKKLDFYKLYIVREATALPTLWFCFVLLYGVICLASGAAKVHADFIPFLQHPIVIVLNIITLGSALLHTVTYYFMTPKVLNIIVKNDRINPMLITATLWIITAIVSIIALIIMYI